MQPRITQQLLCGAAVFRLPLDHPPYKTDESPLSFSAHHADRAFKAKVSWDQGWSVQVP